MGISAAQFRKYLGGNAAPRKRTTAEVKEAKQRNIIRRGEAGPTDVGRNPMLFVLPWPPSVNGMYSVVQGRKILSKKARKYKKATASISIGSVPFVGPVEMVMHFYRPTKTSDVSNRIKAAEDSLTGCAYEDDCQVVRIMAERHEATPETARVEVIVRPFVREVANG